jgi:peptidoglycan/xylan/chitin deacetylase (PgdA/CDA1 family)
MRVNQALTIALLALATLTGQAHGEAAPACPPDALGVSREIKIGGAPRIGLKTYPQTLDLHENEVVLTFDDGPAATTPKVLATLAKECVKATFFLIGRNAAARPDLVRREIAEGHTVGHHSWSHPSVTLRNLPLTAAMADIEHGLKADQDAAGGKASNFFRFPGFGDSPELLDALAKKDMPVFGADLWASDWLPMQPEEELKLLMVRLRRSKGGIVLLHDIQKRTVDMLPALLTTLKAEHFKIVHIIPGDVLPALRNAPAGWTSETEATLRHMWPKTPAPTHAAQAPAGRKAAPVQNPASEVPPNGAPQAETPKGPDDLPLETAPAMAEPIEAAH